MIAKGTDTLWNTARLGEELGSVIFTCYPHWIRDCDREMSLCSPQVLASIAMPSLGVGALLGLHLCVRVGCYLPHVTNILLTGLGS